MNSTTIPPQLVFHLNNPDAKNTIYIGSDPTLNQLTLEITFTVDKESSSSEEASFLSSKPVPKSAAGSAQGSLLYLDLSALKIGEDAFNKITCSAENWAFALYASEGLVCLAPTQDIPLGTDGSIAISITGLVVANPPKDSKVDLSVDFYRVPPVTPSALPQLPRTFYLPVFLQSPPHAHRSLHEDIACEAHPYEPSIYRAQDGCAPAPNEFELVLYSKSSVGVKAGEDTQFIVSFVYAPASDPDGYGALTDTGSATSINVTLDQHASGWTPPPPPSQANPAWILTPPEGAFIVNPNEGSPESSVAFNISHIATRLQPGPTVMYVQYRNIPGYDDGVYAILLYKEPATPEIKYFDVVTTPQTEDPIEYTAYKDPYLNNVHLEYETYGAKEFSLSIEQIRGGLMPGYPMTLPCNSSGIQVMDPNLPPGDYIATLSPIDG